METIWTTYGKSGNHGDFFIGSSMGFSWFGFRQLVTGHHLLGTLWMISTNGAPSSGAPSAPCQKKQLVYVCWCRDN